MAKLKFQQTLIQSSVILQKSIEIAISESNHFFKK